jgi:hypothetical protein
MDRIRNKILIKDSRRLHIFFLFLFLFKEKDNYNLTSIFILYISYYIYILYFRVAPILISGLNRDISRYPLPGIKKKQGEFGIHLRSCKKRCFSIP